MENDAVLLSPLAKTWIFDLDGTIVKHNGYIIDGHDTLLDNAKEYLSAIPPEDMVVIITARTQDLSVMTEKFLHDNEIRYNHIIYDAPMGERILINDRKPSGLNTAVAVNTERDIFCETRFVIDHEL